MCAQTFERTPALLNAFLQNDDTDFWSIIGAPSVPHATALAALAHERYTRRLRRRHGT
jgi:hypothetical protein